MATRIALSRTTILAAALLFGAPEDARAQCRLCSTPTTQVQESEGSGDIQLETQAILDFDRLILIGSGEGTATLLPDGDRSTSGTIEAVSPRAMVGSIAIHGEPGKQVRVDMPKRIEIYSLNGSSNISIDQLETDLPETPRLDSAGNLSFRFGGRVKISGDADGDYRGDISITVEYL